MNDDTTKSFREVLPHRPVQWGRAVHALMQMRGEYSGDRIMDYALALEGDDGERAFQEFRTQPGARELERDRPDLPATLDDWEQLGRLPEQSLGRAYLALARRDGIRVGELVAGSLVLADEQERAPDSLRRWYRDRMVAYHDLLHVLTGYDRDGAGEVQLVAFSLAVTPMRVLRIGLVLALLGVPPRILPRFARDLWRAWRRGTAARISRAMRWEDLLPAPLDLVRAELGVAPLRDAHPKGVWREESGRWLRVHDETEPAV
jgi:ubiquinone biosynthesis protein COQ4